MIDLRDTTFIIPIRIESQDRAFNFQYVIQYLCNNFETNIFVWESGPKPYGQEILRKINKGPTKITYWFEETNDSTFHRTRLLNSMLVECKTKIVVNYDCDILLEPSTYVSAADAIRTGKAHVVYPYFKGMSQKKIYRTTLRSNLLEEQKHIPENSVCGHCQFFNRKAYIEGGMENESYISYGNEDVERMERFQKLGYKVIWLDAYVFHIEHARGPNSGKDNPHFENNELVYKKLSVLSPNELRAHYKTVKYLKKYNMPTITLLTYSDANFRDKQRALIARAKELNVADNYVETTREMLEKTSFYEDNKAMLDQQRGSGYWRWKAFFILETLKIMNESDILLYMDSGDWLSTSPRDFLVRKMRNHDILLTEGGYHNSAYCKKDVFVAMDCDTDRYHNALQVEAGIIVCKKTPTTIHLMEEWLHWCMIHNMVDDTPSVGKNADDFVEHRHDQAILSLMQVFHDIPKTKEMRQFVNCNWEPKT